MREFGRRQPLGVGEFGFRRGQVWTHANFNRRVLTCLDMGEFPAGRV